jgi:hypothetical protein
MVYLTLQSLFLFMPIHCHKTVESPETHKQIHMTMYYTMEKGFWHKICACAVNSKGRLVHVPSPGGI